MTSTIRFSIGTALLLIGAQFDDIEMPAVRNIACDGQKGKEVLLSPVRSEEPTVHDARKAMPELRKSIGAPCNAMRLDRANIDIPAKEVLLLPVQRGVQNRKANIGRGDVLGVFTTSPAAQEGSVRALRPDQHENGSAPQRQGSLKQRSIKPGDSVPEVPQRRALGHELVRTKAARDLPVLRFSALRTGDVHKAPTEMAQKRKSSRKEATGPEEEGLVRAIMQVESGGQPNAGRDVVSDNGRTIGPFCISRAYWQDSGVPGDYQQCRERAYGERVIRGYWRRYCPRGSDETKARVHNGGPQGDKRRATLPYWKKVRRELEKQR
jgi:hypothetical protein